MAEFIGIGDLHLTDHLGQGGLAKYIDNPDKYVCTEVNRVLSYAEKKGVRNIFFYGDICQNPRMSYEAQLAFSSLVSNKDFTFWIIPGNHDMIGRQYEVGHSLELLTEFNRSSHVKYLFRPTNEVIDGAPVRFLPFPHGKFSSKALNVCHLDVYGATSDSGRQILSEGRDRSDNLIVAGHIHTNQKVRNTYYSGTLYQTCFGEKPQKFFHHIQFNNINDYEVSSIPFKSKLKLHTLMVQTKEDIPHDLDFSTNLVKLVIQDGASVQADDYKHLNVVTVRAFQSKKQLASVLTEDLPSNGAELKMSTKEFFSAWVEGADASSHVKASAVALRRRILSSLRA